MSDIIREKELLQYDLRFVKIDQIKLESYIRIGELSNFILFCKEKENKTVFYKYTYYDKELYYITDEILDNNTLNAKEKNYCSSWAREYNEMTKKIDFENPSSLILCMSFERFVVVFQEKNNWLENEGILNAESALAEFIEDHEDDLLEFYDYEEGTSPIDELTDILLADKEFRYSTNKASRAEYMKRFMIKKDNKRFWKLAKGAKNPWEREYRLDSIVNQIYQEYRNQCYKHKIQVGEELPKEDE